MKNDDFINLEEMGDAPDEIETEQEEEVKTLPLRNRASVFLAVSNRF